MSCTSSRCDRALRVVAMLGVLWLVAVLETLACHRAASRSTLRVCADPNNLPFSNRAREGVENALAEVLARALDRDVAYTWFPQRRGFLKNTLNAHKCDLVLGVPAGYELAATTQPYYRSSYVFVSRRDRALGDLRSLDDPRLRGLRIGVHALGDDYANVPPVHALARRGLQDQLVGYSFYGDYTQPTPPKALLDAVARGEVDVAIAWGPLAGWAASQSAVPLAVAAIDRPAGEPLRFSFAIAMAVRKTDAPLLASIDVLLAARHAEIARVLDRFAIPRVAAGGGPR